MKVCDKASMEAFHHTWAILRFSGQFHVFTEIAQSVLCNPKEIPSDIFLRRSQEINAKTAKQIFLSQMLFESCSKNSCIESKSMAFSSMNG